MGGNDKSSPRRAPQMMSRFLRAALGKDKATHAEVPASTGSTIAELTGAPSSLTSKVDETGDQHGGLEAARTIAANHAITAEVDGEKDASIAVVAERNTSATEDAKGSDGVVEDDESKYLSGWKLAPLTFGLCMATFVVALDNTVTFALRHLLSSAC